MKNFRSNEEKQRIIADVDQAVKDGKGSVQSILKGLGVTDSNFYTWRKKFSASKITTRSYNRKPKTQLLELPMPSQSNREMPVTTTEPIVALFVGKQSEIKKMYESIFGL